MRRGTSSEDFFYLTVVICNLSLPSKLPGAFLETHLSFFLYCHCDRKSTSCSRICILLNGMVYHEDNIPLLLLCCIKATLVITQARNVLKLYPIKSQNWDCYSQVQCMVLTLWFFFSPPSQCWKARSSVCRRKSHSETATLSRLRGYGDDQSRDLQQNMPETEHQLSGINTSLLDDCWWNW